MKYALRRPALFANAKKTNGLALKKNSEKKKMILYRAYTDALSDENTYTRLLQSVCQTRQEKVEKMKHMDGKRQSLLAGVLIKYAIEHNGYSYKDCEILHTDMGKPRYFHGGKELFLNSSHSGGAVLVAMSDRMIGCDVEQVARRNGDELKIAKRFFHEREYEHLVSVKEQGEEILKKEFVKYWTLKESFVKCIGDGLRIPLNRFCITEHGDGLIQVEQVENSFDYDFVTMDGADGYHYSACVRRDDRAIVPEEKFVDINPGLWNV